MTSIQLLKLALLFGLVYDDVKKLVVDLVRGKPEREGVFLLGPNTDIKHKLVEQLNMHQPIFDIFGDGKNYIPCTSINILSNNIYIYSYNHKEDEFKVCGKTQNNTIETISNSIKIPFYIKWLGYSSLHFEMFGNYPNFSQKSLISQIKPLPTWSTLIVTAATDHIPLRSISDEILLKNFAESTSNPYIRYIHYLLTNPDKSIFFLNTNSEVRVFTSNIDQLTLFTNESIKNWQTRQISAFTEFIHNNTNDYESRNEIELRDFINIYFNNHSSFNIARGLSNPQNSNTSRYKELLTFNYIAHNKTEKVQTLLSSDVNIESKLLNDATLLFVSAYLGMIEITKLLISFDAFIESQNIDKLTPLTAVTLNNHFEIAELLLSFKANANPSDINGNTPLILATSKKYFKLIELLIKFNAEVNAQNKLGDTALTIAAASGYTQAIKLLLDNGADINVSGNSGTSVYLIAKNGYLETLKLILSYGPNISTVDIQAYGDYEFIGSELTNYETDPVNYILKNNYEITNAVKALDHIMSYNQSEHYVEHISQVKTCLSRLEVDTSYIILPALCGNNYPIQNMWTECC